MAWVSCVNALSKLLKLTIRRDGKVHTMEFAKGVVQNRELRNNRRRAMLTDQSRQRNR